MCLFGVWLRLFFKVFFIRKYIKIIFFNFLKIIFDINTSKISNFFNSAFGPYMLVGLLQPEMQCDLHFLQNRCQMKTSCGWKAWQLDKLKILIDKLGWI